MRTAVDAMRSLLWLEDTRAFRRPVTITPALRVPLNVTALRRGGWAPDVPDPQYVAFATDDIRATAPILHDMGAPLLELPANYFDDLDARFDLDPGVRNDIRSYGLMYEHDPYGDYLHLATAVLGDRVFFEVVERLDGSDGYGTVDAPVRMAAQRRAPARPPRRS